MYKLRKPCKCILSQVAFGQHFSTASEKSNQNSLCREGRGQFSGLSSHFHLLRGRVSFVSIFVQGAIRELPSVFCPHHCGSAGGIIQSIQPSTCVQCVSTGFLPSELSQWYSYNLWMYCFCFAVLIFRDNRPFCLKLQDKFQAWELWRGPKRQAQGSGCCSSQPWTVVVCQLTASQPGRRCASIFPLRPCAQSCQLLRVYSHSVESRLLSSWPWGIEKTDVPQGAMVKLFTVQLKLKCCWFCLTEPFLLCFSLKNAFYFVFLENNDKEVLHNLTWESFY